MKSHTLPTLLLSILCCFFILQSNLAFSQNLNSQSVTSKIESVTVFRTRAQITRSAKANLKEGKNEIIFTGLSPKLIESSFQLLANSSQVTIFSVQPTITSRRNPKAWAISQKIRDSLQNARTAQKELSDDLQILQNEEKLLIDNQKISSQNRPLTPTELAAMADFVRQRITTVRKEIRENKQEENDNNQLIRRLQSDLSRMLNKSTNSSFDLSVDIPSGEVIVSLEAKSAVSVEFMLQYLVKNVSWNPVYDLRAKEVGEPMEISYRAHVSQTTGIDWKDINLTLSTADPTQSTETPEFYAQHLKIFVPQKANEEVQLTEEEIAMGFTSDDLDSFGGGDDWGSGDDWGGEDEKSESIADYTKTKETALAAEFEISLPYTILSDGRKQLVEVSKMEVETDYQYTVFAGKNKEGFLMANLSDWQQYQLVSGDVNIYFENKFVGKTYLDTQNSGDTLAVSLGKDSRIIAERITLKDKNKRKFIGSNIKESKVFEIIIKNNLSRKVSIKIIDQIPLSMDSRIEVETENLSGGELNSRTGQVIWNTEISASDSKKFKLEYTIKYPKGKQLETNFVETN
ncbi:mucoidy inhibitor MuiA family protein [Bernardetia sp. OM2101]|uniref:mucoidy inhibitor MuiA family protein n=1 Tax=Bernardetia sp. OM2101 TaxID=3344876 RepID=UPI0035CF2C9D